MSNLSDTQLVILSAACQREDRSVFPVTAKLSGGPLDKVVRALLKKGLLEEINVAGRGDAWFIHEDAARVRLRATLAACQALGVEGLVETSGSSSEAIDASTSRRARKPRKAAQGRTRADGSDKVATAPSETSGAPVAPTGPPLEPAPSRRS